MSTLYRHTQPGWVVLATTVPAGLLALGVAATSRDALPLGIVAAVILAAAALFSALTVQVDADHLSARFGPGPIRRRIALSDVRAATVVSNPWWYGWGLRLIPGGTLYNVSGLSAVELVLRDGGVWRVGTDEPEALLAAVLARTGPLAPLDAAEQRARGAAAKRTWVVAAALGAAFALGLGGLLAAQHRAPTVTVDASALTIESALYDARVPLSEVRDVALVEQLPRVLARTNGYATGETLRGWFRVEGLGEGRLYVEAEHPPFVVVKHAQGFVIVGFADAARTRQLHDQLRAAAPTR